MTMKRLSVAFIAAAMFVGCSSSQDYIDVSYFGSRSGELNLIFDTEGTDLLSSGKEKKVTLSEPSKAVAPWTALNGGAFYVTTDSEDKMASFGNIVYKTTELPDGEITLQAFSHLGDGDVLVGSDFNGRVWRMKGEDPPYLLGETAYRDVTVPGGEKRTLLMSKGDLTGGKWIGSLGGKILRDPGSGQLEEIGLVEWRLIKIESDSYMSVMMTKLSAKGAKWQGRFNGVLYTDK
jgi:hypothetical protein